MGGTVTGAPDMPDFGVTPRKRGVQMKDRAARPGMDFTADMVSPLTDEDEMLGLPRRRGRASSTLLGV